MLIIPLLLAALQGGPVPGTVDVPAGITHVGLPVDDATPLIAENPGLLQPIGASTPRSRQVVEPFRIGLTELTNEQYLRFVQATNHRPPAHWSKLPEGFQRQWLEENPGQQFLLADYWNKNWEEHEWEMPSHLATSPVIYVDYNDAMAYCTWAGVRLPTEFEWVRAARGNEEAAFPWGDEFDPARLGFEATKPIKFARKLLPVGAFPEAASPYGCLDLLGNVWEWTASGASALPKFKSFKVKTKFGKKVDVYPTFDAGLPVIRGGSWISPALQIHIDFRTGRFKTDAFESLGFRIASHKLVGRNAVENALRTVDPRILGKGGDVASSLTLGIEHYDAVDAAELAAGRSTPKKSLPDPELPGAYGAIAHYRTVSLAPRAALPVTSIAKMEKAAFEEAGPLSLGVITTTERLTDPALPAGTYVLAYMPPIEGAPPSYAESEHALDLSAFTIELDDPYILFLSPSELGQVLGVARLLRVPSMESSKNAKMWLRLNANRHRVDCKLLVPVKGGRKRINIQFSFGLPDKDLVENYWDGVYEYIPVEEEPL